MDREHASALAESNLHLQMLVAELLKKNEELRQQLAAFEEDDDSLKVKMMENGNHVLRRNEFATPGWERYRRIRS